MKRETIGLIALTLLSVLHLLAGSTVYRWAGMQWMCADRVEEPRVRLLVARVDIDPFVRIDKPELVFVTDVYPESIAPGKFIKSFEQLQGRRLNQRLAAGSPVTRDHLLQEDEVKVLQPEPGQRAVAIPWEWPCGPGPRPGCRVDVFGPARGHDGMGPAPDDQEQVKGPLRVIARDRLVLNVDNLRDVDVNKKAGWLVTISATPEEAVRLEAARVGELRLALHPLDDWPEFGKE
jgi:Flp pilus assembly protein CpaB